MKLTVLQQQNKAFIEENPEAGAHVANTLERVNHSLHQPTKDVRLCSASLACRFAMHPQNLTYHVWSPGPPNAAFGRNPKIGHRCACGLHPA